MSSPDRVNASPATSPVKEAAQRAVAHAATVLRQPAVHGAGTVSVAEPEHEVEAGARAEQVEAQASGQPQPASAAPPSTVQQDGLGMTDDAGEAEPSHQATVDEKLIQQQDGSNIEEVAGAADPGEHVLVGEDLKKQPGDVLAAYPMIVHAGAVPRPPSRQTSSEFLASIAGTPQSMRWVLPVPILHTTIVLCANIIIKLVHEFALMLPHILLGWNGFSPISMQCQRMLLLACGLLSSV